MAEPTFLVIGTGRSGTTSLHRHLRAHPEVFVPEVKAPSYFYAVDEPDRGARRRAETRHSFVRDRDAYFALFDGTDRWRARGEVSPSYLAARRVPERIAVELPRTRLIAVLRDPSARLVARFVARRRDGLEPAARLDEVVDRELAAGLDLSDTAGTYVAAGFVSHVLQRYFELFGPEALAVHLFDDLVADPGAVVAEVFEFIGVDPTIDVDTATRHNASGGVIRDPVTRWVWGRSAPLRQRVGPTLPRSIRDATFRVATRRVDPVTIEPATRRRLAEIYRDEVAALADLLHRDLGHWGSAGDTP